ncbi:hypothetical protein, conserved [Trypanosoma brucei brucei TREU927]|uniref:WW domain-containing protein n=1 Tax=Trypanosoma brucei brucei (strain 927/4 GUTat10.1) TaxID=185431 RepID=Q57Z68_TRYB2|nr:hypothetical protein, conserved [Trypanosoma brucei brucei TREU927]AAX79565.1 hypothetical protein, conserved [Trypanosoma brucei]AAZ11438.1 hypothetical protein, conserved [Trypanosoma brucei brucei TREU927]
MYTFKRPQQQQPQLQGANMGVTDAVDPPATGAPFVDGDNTAYPAVAAQASQEGVGEEAQQQQHQQPAGYLSEEATAEEALQYCQQMVLRNPVSPPPTWSGARQVLPATVPELHLIPSAPVQAQQPPHITPSASVVLQLDGVVPEGMTPKEYGRSLVKYIVELLAYQRATTAITSLRFVKMGTELMQLVVTFGRDVRLAMRVMEEFTNVGLCAGFVLEDDGDLNSGGSFGGNKRVVPPCATFQVTDYQFLLNGGRGITSEDIGSLFQPETGNGENDMNVISGFEPGVFYVAVKKPGTVYEWLWNPFCSFLVQYTLFQRCGVLITMADCMDEFSQSKGGPRVAVGRQKGSDVGENSRLRRDVKDDTGETNDYSNNGAKYEDDEAADDDDYLGKSSDIEEKRGGRWVRSGSPMWSRNAKEEVDIFGGLGTGVKPQKLSEEDFVDNDITELLQEVKADGQKDVRTAEQQQKPSARHRSGQSAPRAEAHAPPAAEVSVPHVAAAPPRATPAPIPHSGSQSCPPYGSYYGYAAPTAAWQQPPPPPPPRTDTPPPYQAAVMSNINEMKAPKTDYPELVEEEISNEDAEEGNTGDNNTTQQPPPQMMYWGSGGGPPGGAAGYYPPSTYAQYAAPPYGYPIPQHHHSHAVPSSMPSILGQSTFGSFVPTVRVEERVAVQVQPITINGAPCVSSITVDDVNSLAAKIVERVQLAFPLGALQNGNTNLLNSGETTTRVDGEYEGPIETAQAMPSNNEGEDRLRDKELMFPSIPCDFSVPPLSPEVEDIVSFLQQHSADIRIILTSTSEEFNDGRSRIVEALLVENSGSCNDEQAAWDQQYARPKDGETIASVEATTTAGKPATETEGTQPKKIKQLPTLLPYLLASKGAISILTALANCHAAKLLPLLCRCILPFLLDTTVVQSVGVVALRSDPTAANPLVLRLLRHWASLAMWLHEHIQSLAGESAQTSQAAAMGRLTSQVGSAIDALLTAMSSEQRESVAEFLAETKALETFFQSMPECPQSGKKEENLKGEVSRQSSFMLWDIEGAVYRSLLRLYLNADFFNGEEFANILYASKTSLTRDHFYFIRVALSKSNVSPTLSVETARLCGAFLRLMELMPRDIGKNKEVDKNSGVRCVFTDHDALNLLEAALRVQPSEEAYQSLRSAYFAKPASEERYEQIEKKLSSTVLPPPYPQQPANITTAILGTSSSYNPQPSSDAQQHVTTRRWLPEWTAAMRHYPRTGEPFTPLPTGWTSAMSRSYGYYYFRDGKSPATYKHPTDATEFMVAPQAFLLEARTAVTLDEVLEYANRMSQECRTDDASREQPPIITKEVAEEWINDQRIRLEALDLAALDLMKVSYHTVGSGGRRYGERNEHTDGDGGRRDRRRRHHSHRRHGRSRRKRSRSRSRSRSTRGSRERRHSDRSLSKTLKFSSYPPRGHPFPHLPYRWTCNLSASKGLYYFRAPTGSLVFTHPDTRREYRVTPQAFALHHNIQVAAIATTSRRPVEEVERWLSDQRNRDEDIDTAVVRMIPITYVWSSCDDEEGDDEGKRFHREEGSSRLHRKDSRR